MKTPVPTKKVILILLMKFFELISEKLMKDLIRKNRKMLCGGLGSPPPPFEMYILTIMDLSNDYWS